MKKKLTKQFFVSIYPDMVKIRRNDPIQFNVLFNDWKRLRQKYI